MLFITCIGRCWLAYVRHRQLDGGYALLEFPIVYKYVNRLHSAANILCLAAGLMVQVFATAKKAVRSSGLYDAYFETTRNVLITQKRGLVGLRRGGLALA